MLRCSLIAAFYSITTIRSSGATLIDSVWDFKCKFRNGFFEKVFVREFVSVGKVYKRVPSKEGHFC